MTGEEVADALRAADVHAARGRVVLRALGDHGIVVSVDATVGTVAAARTTTTKRASARTKADADSAPGGTRRSTTTEPTPKSAKAGGGRASTARKAAGTTPRAQTKSPAGTRAGSAPDPTDTDGPPESIDDAVSEDVALELDEAGGTDESSTAESAPGDVAEDGDGAVSTEPAAAKGDDDTEEAGGFVIRDDDED
ncbi:MAG: hypothetical protein ACRCY9_12145, partial [Phycicoccus sp.]